MRPAGHRSVQESELLTADQLGAIHCEFDRLGLGNDDDRPRRLEILAVLTRQSDLASTTELVMGKPAGRSACSGRRVISPSWITPSRAREPGPAPQHHRASLSSVR